MKNNDKKYIVSYKVGMIIFLISIILAIMVFGAFYLIQNKKDRDFQSS